MLDEVWLLLSAVHLVTDFFTWKDIDAEGVDQLQKDVKVYILE